MIKINDILEVEQYIDDMDVVIFDLDDTLYSEKEYIRSGFVEVGNMYPFIHDLPNRLWNAFLDGKPAFDFVLSQEGLIREKEKCLDIYRNHFPHIHLYPGVKEMIYRIKANKMVGIITDGRPEGQRAKIKALGLENENVVITDELGGIEYRKPCEKAFVLMKEYFRTDFSRMAYVGDNMKKDFTAPVKLGMRSIFFNNVDGLYSCKLIK